MKTVVLLLLFGALVSAAPKPTKLNFRNAYKKPLGDIIAKPKPRIIGGQEAEPHSIPYQVFLDIYTEDEGWYCGGSLISENYVLTAGHCGIDAVEAFITLGAHRALQNEDTQIRLRSTNIKVHEDYDDYLLINDVTVIQLPQAVVLNDVIQVVPLPSRADASNTYTGDIARVSGWGLTDDYDDELSPVLEYVDVEVISNQDCEDVFGALPDSNICTSGANNKAICAGDSGGPLTFGGVLIGVASFGTYYCNDGNPSGYARVTSYLDWLAANTDVQIK